MSDLRDEIQQTRPFDSAGQEAFLSLARTAAVLSHETERELARLGLTPTQYNALRILRGAGEAGLCGTEIRDRMIAQVPDVTRLLDRLDERGLVQRRRERANRRFVRARITDAGLRLLEETDPVMRELHQRQFGHMSDAQLNALVELTRLARMPGQANPDRSEP
jgi:DNA-binding MarR family transcriptional regulator